MLNQLYDLNGLVSLFIITSCHISPKLFGAVLGPWIWIWMIMCEAELKRARSLRSYLPHQQLLRQVHISPLSTMDHSTHQMH
jgi:hypothetical protein